MREQRNLGPVGQGSSGRDEGNPEMDVGGREGRSWAWGEE